MVLITKKRHEELLAKEATFDKSLLTKAQEANAILETLGIENHTESGMQLRESIGMELLGGKYPMMNKHSKATFVKQHSEIMPQIRDMLIQEGVLSRPKIEHKKR